MERGQGSSTPKYKELNLIVKNERDELDMRFVPFAFKD